MQRINFVVVMSAFLVGGCATSASQWKLAQQINTIAAYQTFVREYPDSPQAAEAKLRLQQREKLDANWVKLQSGMTYNEVDALLEINDPEVKETFGRIMGIMGSMESKPDMQAQFDAPIHHNNPPYDLHFVNGRLVHWSKPKE